jgi:hypothetical protein
MNLLKTPHQMLMEEAGASPLPTPGLLNTPKQMLFQESGMLPKFADGGRMFKEEENLSPEQMQAAMIINGHTPPKFAYASGGVAKVIDYALKGLMFGPDTVAGVAKVAKGKPASALENVTNIGTYMLPLTPMAGVMAASPSELGDDSLWNVSPEGKMISGSFQETANAPTSKFEKWLHSLGNK